MNRISTFTQFFSSSNGISDGQKNMGRSQEQTASGKVANDVKGFGDDAGRLLSAKSYGDRLDTRAETLKGLQSRAEIEATALEQGTAAITSVKQAIMNAIANQNGAGLRAAMEQALSIVGTSANVQYNGQAVFGGEWGVGDPFIPASLDALALQPNTDPNWVDTGRNRTVMIEDNRAIELSGSAKELFKPFVDFLRDVRVWENANGAFQNKLSNVQQTYLQSLVPGFSAIETTAIDKAASAGSTAKQLELAMDFNAMQRDAFNKTIGDQENVNLAEVAARLSAAQTQYQASAAIFGRLKDMNLLQYLR